MDLSLDCGRIDLWCTYISEIDDDSLWPRYHALLSAEERRIQMRFLFARDQRRYLVTRALVRTVLSRYVAARPQDWMFSAGVRGRPVIAAPHPAPPLEFNISHAADLILLGVTTGRVLGIDTEGTEGRAPDIHGLERYFAPEEGAALLALSPAEQHRRFFELWTLKESYIKARGMGLAIPLDAFRFELAEQRLSLHMRPELGDSPERWRVWQLLLRPDYLTAICATRGEDPPPRIVVREAVPLGHERIVEVTPFRATD